MLALKEFTHLIRDTCNGKLHRFQIQVHNQGYRLELLVTKFLTLEVLAPHMRHKTYFQRPRDLFHSRNSNLSRMDIGLGKPDGCWDLLW